MSLWKIAWRSIQQRGLSSALTSLSMALGVTLLVAVLVVHGVVKQYFSQGAQGYHLIVGAKGGKLQLVLNTVFHLSQPIENIPWSLYEEFREGAYANFTALVVPVCLGDSYRHGDSTFRVVGTTPDMFDKIEYGREEGGKPKKYTFADGRNFRAENFFEAVIGSVVAAQTGLAVGDEIRPSHGIVEAGAEADEHREFTIVGILDPTGTPNDRAVFINMEGFYLLENHALAEDPQQQADHHSEQEHAEHDEGGDGAHDAGHADGSMPAPLPESRREVTALLVLLKSDLFTQSVFTTLNEGNVAQAVFPSREIRLLFSRIVGPMQMLLQVLTMLIVLVAGIGIMVSIYNSMSDRRREIAVMRALGAGKITVFSIVLLESILLSLMGGVAGIVLGHGMIGLGSDYIAQSSGVVIDFLQFDPNELILIPGLVGLASVVGLVPGLMAYRTDVAEALSSSP